MPEHLRIARGYIGPFPFGDCPVALDDLDPATATRLSAVAPVVPIGALTPECRLL